LACAVALATVAVADHAHARARGPVEPVEPGDPPEPPEPPVDPVEPPAPSCPAPTAQQCQDPAYLDTTCGYTRREACGAIVAPIYRNNVQAIPRTTQVLKKVGAVDRLTTAKQLDPVAMPARKLTFGSLSFATAVQLGRKSLPSAETANIEPQHPDYEANGKAVASCQEYAYESLYDHERFAEAAETCGANAECVYQLSLRTETPGLKTTMLKKNGLPMSTQTVRPGAYSAFKNAFFVPTVSELKKHPRYATDASFRAKADAIVAHVTSTPKTTAASELAWHRSMHDQFAAAPITPAEASNIKQRVAAYDRAEGTVSAANLAIALLDSVIPGQSGETRARSEALRAEYAASRARALDEMARYLFAEWDHVSATDGTTVDRGCLSRTSVKCDWSPQKFVSRYASHRRYESENLFNACIEATAGNFSKVPAEYRVDTDALATWIEAQALPKLGTTIVGERLNDGDEWGDRSWFAAGYSYDAGWQLAAERQSGTNRICKLKGNAYAQGSANAWALGHQIPVLDTRHKLSVRESGDAIVINSHLRVLGQDLYTPIAQSFTAPSATPVEREYDKTVAKRAYTKWIELAGVSVKLMAMAELKAGAKIKAHATAASGCNPDNLAYDAGISATPWIDAHVTAEASAGVAVLQAGVRGEVDLLAISAPASASTRLVGGINDITLQMRAKATTSIDALDGKLSVFLESCIPWVGCSDLASKQVYAWDGYSWEIPLFAYEKDVKINVFDAATKPAPVVWGPINTGGVIKAL